MVYFVLENFELYPQSHHLFLVFNTILWITLLITRALSTKWCFFSTTIDSRQLKLNREES